MPGLSAWGAPTHAGMRMNACRQRHAYDASVGQVFAHMRMLRSTFLAWSDMHVDCWEMHLTGSLVTSDVREFRAGR